MARVTIEDCLKEMSNRFALVHMAAQRVRQLRRGAAPRVNRKNKDVVIALREVAAGRVILAAPDEAVEAAQD
jgi:DNA-directed RNA polymerase subunit omega